MKAINLKTEYLNNPIGIDIVKPRLFWNCEGGVEQTAYSVLAKDSSGKVWRQIYDGGNVYDAAAMPDRWEIAEV